MVGFVAALLFLLALGLPGVAGLRRLDARLTALEWWAYGLPLGVVVGSLALLVLAVATRALSLPLVLLVALASVAVAATLGPWRALVARLGGGQTLGFATTIAPKPKPKRRRRADDEQPGPDTAPAPAPGLLDRALATFGPLALCIIAAFIIRWIFLWRSVLVTDASGLIAAQINIL